MKSILTLPMLLVSSVCWAQTDYTYLVEAPAKLGNESIPAYRTLADTAGKPFTKLFAHSNVRVSGRLGKRWVILQKGDNEYVVRASELPADVQQAVASATPLKLLPFDPTTGKLVYTEVVQVPGASQAELYARAKLWFANTFKSAKDVVQAEDKEAGIIQGTGFQDITVVSMGLPVREKLWYTIKIAIKEGRYKYDITNFRVQNYPSEYNINPGEPVAAEGYIKTDQKGAMLSIARSARREVAFAGTNMTKAITSGMSKPAAGSDF
jgi:hypothetical protein